MSLLPWRAMSCRAESPMITALVVGAVGCGSPTPGSSTDASSSSTATSTSSGSSDATASSGDEPGTATTDGSDGGSSTTAADSTGEAPGMVHIRFAFIHGVLGSADSQLHAENEADDLETFVLDHADSYVAAYQDAHPGRVVAIESARVNLYVDGGGALLRPGLDDVADGSGQITANRWRQQLVTKLDAAYPDGVGNLVLVGHSTGARVALEVAADVGSDGQPGTMQWGLQARIAGVVTLHGMIDRLDNPEYDFIGPTGFETGCKLAQADGWCEYAARISARPAAAWTATHRRWLALVSWADCSPSLWSGENDKSLPFRAQASAAAFGTTMTRAADGTWVPAHGVLYGNFCHSDVTSSGSPVHGDAVAASMTAVLRWIFENAPRPVVTDEDAQRIDLAPLGSGVWSREQVRGDDCPPELHDDGAPELAGVCLHGGDADHALDGNNASSIVAQGDCRASARWQHLHAGEQHGARLFAKTHAVDDEPGLIATLAVEP